MQMIMFFVGSDASGATHITRTTASSPAAGPCGGRLAEYDTEEQAQVVMVEQQRDRLALPPRVTPLHRRAAVLVSAPSPARAAAHIEYEECERWDGLY